MENINTEKIRENANAIKALNEEKANDYINNLPKQEYAELLSALELGRNEDWDHSVAKNNKCLTSEEKRNIVNIELDIALKGAEKEDGVYTTNVDKSMAAKIKTRNIERGIEKILEVQIKKDKI
jgi:hypothetical protein